MHAERRVGAEPERVDHGDHSRKVVPAPAEQNANDGRADDDFDVARIGEQRGNRVLDEKAIADQPTAETRDQREGEHTHHVIILLDRRKGAVSAKAKVAPRSNRTGRSKLLGSMLILRAS